MPKFVGGGRPFLPEICVQSDPPPFKTAQFHSASTVIASEKSSIITYRKSTTRFPTSHRRTVYVTPKSPKGGTKTRYRCSCQFNSTSLEKNLLQSFFVWKLPATKLYLHHSPIQRSIDRLRATSPSTWNWRSKWRTPSENVDFQSFRLVALRQ